MKKSTKRVIIFFYQRAACQYYIMFDFIIIQIGIKLPPQDCTDVTIVIFFMNKEVFLPLIRESKFLKGNI